MRGVWRGAAVVAWLGCAAGAAAQADIEIEAARRVFPEAGPGVLAMKSRPAPGDPSSRQYYILTSSERAIAIFDAEGQHIGRFPPAAGATEAPAPGVHFGVDFDFLCPAEGACRVCIADRGGDAVKVFDAAGERLLTIPFPAPTSVAVLPVVRGDERAVAEIAVASAGAPGSRAEPVRLVTIFDAHGKLRRDFGLPLDVVEVRPGYEDPNRALNAGRLATDAAHHLYYSFSFLPEPTVRKYDRYGYVTLEIELATPEFFPSASSARRDLARQQGRRREPVLRPVIHALGVDPETQEVWMGIGGRLLHFSADGTRRATYRIFTDTGARLEPTAILVERDRLLVASETLGIFEFPRPDKPRRR